MNLKDLSVPKIKKLERINGIVIKHLNKGIVVSCEEGAYLGIILSKEAKDLERNGYDLSVGATVEAELLDPRMLVDEEWYYIISITKLLQYSVWDDYMKKAETDEIMTVIPTEANLWWLLVDIYGIKGFLPLSQLAPVHYPRVEDGDQEHIFDHLLKLIWEEFKVRVINIDEDNKRMIFSEREGLREEREKIMENLETGNEYEWVISGISSYGLFVTIGGGLEGLVHISEITYGHVHDIHFFGKVGDKCKVKVIWFEDGKISFSMKKMRKDPWKIIPETFSVWDIVEGEIIRFVPYGAFIRLYEDINGLIHLSEISKKPIGNPSEVLRLWQRVAAKVILLDPRNRKAWLTIKGIEKDKIEEIKQAKPL